MKYCPLCKKPHHDKVDNLWKLYFNKSTGAFNCFRCGCNGSLFAFKQRVRCLSRSCPSVGACRV